MAKLVQSGYGQVEPNHLSAQRNGQIYAQLPVNAAIEQLENGQFVKYDYSKQEVNFNGIGEYMMVFNEVKLYDPKHSYKDFVFKRSQFTDGQLYPRVIKTMPGDIFTTNMVDVTTAHGPALVGKSLQVDSATGTLKEIASPVAGEITFVVAKAYTLADGQPAVKLYRTV